MPLLLLFCFVTIQGSFLDGSTPIPKSGTVLTESHFSMLLNLLVDERNIREQLERIVKQNQQEIANFNEKFIHCNCYKQDVNVDVIINKTTQLEYKVEVLQKSVHSVQVKSAQMNLKQVLTENISRNLEKDIAELKQIPGDLHRILMLQNKTMDLEMKQRQHENTLHSFLSSGNAGSQDSKAIINKPIKSNDRTIELQGELHNTNNRLNFTVSGFNGRLEEQMQNMHSPDKSTVNVQNTYLDKEQKPLDSAVKQLGQVSNRGKYLNVFIKTSSCTFKP